jgi:hypothetical protein
MGKGIALAFKRIYPEMFSEYQALCEEQQLQIGTLHLYRTANKWILNFPTKTSWRQPSRLEYIEAGLNRFREIYRDAGIYSIAFPPLGCGNGELSFDDVRPVMEKYLQDLPIDVFIYAPHQRHEPAEHRDPAQIRAWLRSMPQYLGFDEVWSDLRTLLAEQNTFRTFSGSAEFSATLIDEPGGEGIRVHAAGSTLRFTKEELCEQWAELRQHKILTTKDLPSNSSRRASYLFPLLAELPYVERIVLTDSYLGLDLSPPLGIQLLPVVPSDAQQRELAIV